LGNTTNNGALIVAGSSATGIVTISGNYTQSSSAMLNMEIGGSTAGTGYDQMQISGTATLAGSLNVSLLGGYSPASGTSFSLLTYGSRSGSFSSINSGGTSFTAHYNSADLTLVAMADTAAAESDSDRGPLEQAEDALPERVLALAAVAEAGPSAVA